MFLNFCENYCLLAKRSYAVACNNVAGDRCGKRIL